MKPIWKEALLAAILGLMLPGTLLNTLVALDDEQAEAPAEYDGVQPPTVGTEHTEGSRLQILFRDSDSVAERDMDDYLVGVLLAEMPASFETEAKKAQAVAARTFALKAAVTGGKHGDSSVCGDSGCCQAYIAPEEYLARGGSADAVEQARAAVEATSGYVLTYEGVLIEATYFSCSGGSTEDAVAVWGSDYPYLRAVESPGEEGAAHYTDTAYFTAEEFQAALGTSLTGSPAGWFGFTTYTAGGGVNTMRIGNRDYKGTELRRLLGLRSTAFSVSADADGVSITTRGFGHRVGMSQYGADAMAAAGSDYREILGYYYGGTTLTLWEPEEN